MGRWIENGAKLAWLVDPYAKSVHIYAPGAAPSSARKLRSKEKARFRALSST
jgi:hypothetical protein